MVLTYYRVDDCQYMLISFENVLGQTKLSYNAASLSIKKIVNLTREDNHRMHSQDLKMIEQFSPVLEFQNLISQQLRRQKLPADLVESGQDFGNRLYPSSNPLVLTGRNQKAWVCFSLEEYHFHLHLYLDTSSVLEEIISHMFIFLLLYINMFLIL